MKQFLCGANGQLSSKRLLGSFMIILGALMKLGLFIYGFLNQPAVAFTQLDACADSLIYTGAALLGTGVFENFKKSEIKNVKHNPKNSELDS